MKALKTVLNVLTALAAVAGAVYVVATYGDKIVAWAKKVLASLPCPNCEKDADVVAEESAFEEAPVAEAPAEEPAAEAEEVPVVEVPAEAPAAQTQEPVAEEADFE